MRPDDLAAAVALAIGKAFAPVTERLAALEVRIEQMGPSIDSLIAREGAALTRDLATIRERVTAIEVRPPVPGPPGEPGRDGQPGPKGDPGLQYLGVHVDGKGYDRGDLVTWAGGTWHCNAATTARPGEGSDAWTLMVKRGRDAKGGR